MIRMAIIRVLFYVKNNEFYIAEYNVGRVYNEVLDSHTYNNDV